MAEDILQPFKLDFDIAGRQPKEVREPGYEGWVVNNAKTDQIEFDDLSFFLASTGEGKLQSAWYKGGIGNAKLANDGVKVDLVEGIEPGEDPESNNVKMELTIRGLNPGQHSLLTYHNIVSGPDGRTFPNFNLYVGDKLVAANVTPTIRVEKNQFARKIYQYVQVAEPADGKETELKILIEMDPATTANYRTVILNGLEIDYPNPDKQAVDPSPENRDEWVDADTGSYTLTWTAAADAVSHDVYFGTSEEAVENADRNSPEFKGTLKLEETSYELSGLYSMNTYYWRIDETDSDGEVWKGQLWWFRPRQLAFKGAEGYGRFARGGRGGIVYHVTNLEDSGPGSLREGIEGEQYQGIPRTIVFDVAGIIRIKSRLLISDPYVTVAGQTAPGKGIVVTGNTFGIAGGHDIIMRHIRTRVWVQDEEETTDGMGQSGNQTILDHCSISWSKDEATSSRGGKNITFQRCFISEPLNRANHKNYEPGKEHGYAGSISGDISSYHHNLIAHAYGRSWSLAGGLDGDGYFAGRLDIFNNVVYNWYKRTTDGGAHQVNFVNNYYKPGVETVLFEALRVEYDEGHKGTQQYYCNGNFVEGHYEDLSDPLNGCKNVESNPDPWVSEPFFPSYAEVHTAKDAYKVVLSDVGANQPVFDDHDVRLVEETRYGTWTYKGSYIPTEEQLAAGALPQTKGIIDDPKDVGGFECYPCVSWPDDYDSDKDGLPDWWERIIGTDPNGKIGDFTDANTDPNGDGYTHLDHFLEWMAKPHYQVFTDQTVIVDLAALSRGFELDPVYSVSQIENCQVTIEGSVAKVTHSASVESLSSFVFTVTDSEGTSMSREIGLRLSV